MTEETNEAVPELEIKDSYLITKDNLSKRKNKQYDLINNTDESTKYLLRNKAYTFNFDQAFYCQKIIVKSTNKDISGLTITPITPFGREKEITISNKESGHIAVTTEMVINGFTIKAPFRILDKISINSIKVTGYVEQDFEDIENKVKDYQRISERITKQKNELQQSKLETSTLLQENSSQLEVITKKIALNEIEAQKILLALDEVKKEKALEELELAKTKSTLEEINKNIQISKNNLDQIEQKSKTINKEIADTEKQLATLVDNKNLFAYEIEEYVKQGNRDIQSYTILAFLPWLIIAYVTWYLFNGSVEISKISNSLNSTSITDIIISRIPFTIIAGAIIIVSYEISKIFVGKIIEINTQKLRLSEIGIISKDISYASTSGLDLEEKEQYELRTKLKMDLIRHHLKKLDPELFEYEIDPSIWKKYTSFLSERIIKKTNTPPEPDKD